MELAAEGTINTTASREKVWALFSQFEKVAKLIPSVKSLTAKGPKLHAQVAVQLGALSVTSQLVLEVTKQVPNSCIEAKGWSFLGETLHDQVKPGGPKGIPRNAKGMLHLQLNLEPSHETDTLVISYRAEVEAYGRLRRIYKSILKNKAPAMMEAFAANIQTALEDEIKTIKNASSHSTNTTTEQKSSHQQPKPEDITKSSESVEQKPTDH